LDKAHSQGSKVGVHLYKFGQGPQSWLKVHTWVG